MTRTKVCVIGGACTKGDAISAAIAADIEALSASEEFEPFLLSGKCELELPHANVRGLKELIYHPRFVGADIRLFHFGYWSELFNAVLLNDGKARRIVRFHNVAPPEIVDPAQRSGVEKARRQVAVITKADEVWPISAFNGRTLTEMGFAVDPSKTLTMPVDPLTDRLDPRDKCGPITIAYVGRIVPAKGVHVLIDAFERLTAKGFDDVELVIIGSCYIRGYASEMRARINQGPLKNARFLGKLSAAKLADAYRRASIVAIPSLHEGLCVPVIEALQAGAIPVVSNAAALPETLNGLGRLTAVGDAAALAECLKEVVEDLRQVRRDPISAKIKVERGALTIDAYQRAVTAYLERFTPATLGAELRDRLRLLARREAPVGRRSDAETVELDRTGRPARIAIR